MAWSPKQRPTTYPQYWDAVSYQRGKLPHLVHENATYFVTFCLRGSTFRNNGSRQSNAHESDEAKRGPDFESVVQMAEPISATNPKLLEIPKLAALVESALLFFDDTRYLLHAWCVMPDHVHVIVQPQRTTSLSSILHSWKSFTAKQANQMLEQSGEFWQSESFDHMIRNEETFERFVGYVEANPVQAGLCLENAEWPWSSARFR